MPRTSSTASGPRPASVSTDRRGRAHSQSLAARILAAVVVHGRYLDSALHESREQAGALAPLVQEMTYGVARHYFSLTAIAGQLLRQPLKARDEDIRLLLLVGLYQLRDMRTPPARAVNETVEAAETSASRGPRASSMPACATTSEIVSVLKPLSRPRIQQDE